MVTVPNQKVVKVQKEQCDNEHLYAKYNLKALQHAMLDLKGETFKMWCYLSKNQNNYEFALSKVDAMTWGMGSKSSYDRAVQELIDKRYLVETSPNHFDFFELPREEEKTIYITKRQPEEFTF